jgi:hypothetical protein
MLWTWAIIVIIVAILDYVVPVWGTRKYGGTKAGVRGSIIGLIIGIFFLPLGPFGLFGIIGGPFIGAWIGEIFAGQEHNKALRAAFGSFVGFLENRSFSYPCFLFHQIHYSGCSLMRTNCFKFHVSD